MYKQVIKPIIDVIIGLSLLPILLIAFAVVGISIKLDDHGPIMYNAQRLGYNGTVYTMYKFRTMKVNAEMIMNADGSTYNAKDDPRLTRVGRILRETSLDELPQIINVIKGDMSFVGPRPSLGNRLSTYKDDEMDKLKVKPGITGYTQAYYRNGLTTREKRLKDSWYANHISWLLDFKIILRTVMTVLKREDIYTN